MNVQRLTLDLDKSSVPRGRVTIAQCDHDGTTVEAEIYDNGIALSTSGLSAYLVMRLPDGRHYYRVPATLDGHVATALVDEAYAATVVGTTEIAYFELVGSGGVVCSTSRFAVRVLPSATAGATVPETWDGEVERLIQQLDDAIETATDAANVANAAAANADATADGVESRVQEMAQDAAETATADAEQRIQDAIDAMGDISELAVPLMSKDIRGGARIQPDSGLEITDTDNLRVRLALESDGAVRGGLAEVTAKGHAEQDGTPTPDSPVEIQVVRGRNLLDVSTVQIGKAWNGSTNSARAIVNVSCEPNTTYTISNAGVTVDALYVCEKTSSADTEVIVAYDLQKNGTLTITTKANTRCITIQFNKDAISTRDVASAKPQLTLGSTPQPYVPYGHVGLEVQGKNLLDESNAEIGTAWNGAPNSARARIIVPVDKGQTYTISVADSGSFDSIYANTTDSVPASGAGDSVIPSRTFVATGAYLVIGFSKSDVTKADIEDCHIQLELGSTATEYEPYHHTTTPIPLPSRGWVGSLPDGTADVLTLDGAGKVTWELADAETTTAATDGITGTVGVDVLSTTGQIADGATVLYKLATPTTEDLGYIDPPSIDGECQISIPELDALGVKYFVDDSAGTLARQWYERAQSEYGDRIAALEEAVAEIIAG